MKKIIIKLFFILVIIALPALFFYTHPPQKQYRFLLMCSSFKRPMFLSGQIFRLMNQTYQNFDISVSVKGVEPDKSLMTFEKEWRPLIEKKRLFLRYDRNRDQLSNLLDTVRNINLNNYDYFCKIDDDDWYAPEYLETINNNLNNPENKKDLPNPDQEIYITFTRSAYNLMEDINSTYIQEDNSDLIGPTICISRNLLKILLKIKKNPASYKKYLPDEPTNLHRIREDRLIHHLGMKLGEMEWSTDEPLVVYGLQYPSVTRNKNYIEKTDDEDEEDEEDEEK